jgi:putative SOS response-associated peptidase YedK
MCTLYRLASGPAEIARLFEAELRTSWDPPTSFHPDRPAPVVGHGRQGRVLAEAIWGIAPPPGVKRPVVNIRNLQSPFWRGALARPGLRCLVPASSFTEWSDAPDPATGRRRLHDFALRPPAPFAFAGLVRTPPPGTDGPPRFAFLTCPPNAVVAPIHAKAMPVILEAGQWQAWLDGAPADAFQAPCPADRLQMLG